MKKAILLGWMGAALILLVSLSSCADPRKNCNHPQHGAWAKEQQMRKRGF